MQTINPEIDWTKNPFVFDQENLNNSPDEIFKIGLAGLLHDLGKALIGIYPVGSVVKLEEDFTAVVSQSNQKKPTQPKVIMVFDPKGNFMQSDEYDISKGEAPAIREAIINNKVNPLRVLSRTA